MRTSEEFIYGDIVSDIHKQVKAQVRRGGVVIFSKLKKHRRQTLICSPANQIVADELAYKSTIIFLPLHTIMHGSKSNFLHGENLFVYVYKRTAATKALLSDVRNVMTNFRRI